MKSIQDSNGNHRTRNARTRTKAGNKGGAGAYIASGSRDKTIRIWDTQTQQEVMTLVRRLRSFFASLSLFSHWPLALRRSTRTQT